MLPHASPLIAGATRVAKTSLLLRGKPLRTTRKTLEHIITAQSRTQKSTATDPEETLTIPTTSSLSLSKVEFSGQTQYFLPTLCERELNGQTTRQTAAVRSESCMLEVVVVEVAVLLVVARCK